MSKVNLVGKVGRQRLSAFTPLFIHEFIHLIQRSNMEMLCLELGTPGYAKGSLLPRTLQFCREEGAMEYTLMKSATNPEVHAGRGGEQESWPCLGHVPDSRESVLRSSCP